MCLCREHRRQGRRESRLSRPQQPVTLEHHPSRHSTVTQIQHNNLAYRNIDLLQRSLVSCSSLDQQILYCKQFLFDNMLKKNLILNQMNKCMLYQEIKVVQIVNLTYSPLWRRVVICLLLTSVIIVNSYSAKAVQLSVTCFYSQ